MSHYTKAELVFQSYIPSDLELGMYFVNVSEEERRLFELKEIPNNQDEFLVEFGAPINFYIVKNGELLARNEQLAWIDDDEEEDVYYELSIDDLNYIINQLQGEVKILVDEDEQVILEENKVILKIY